MCKRAGLEKDKRRLSFCFQLVYKLLLKYALNIIFYVLKFDEELEIKI